MQTIVFSYVSSPHVNNRFVHINVCVSRVYILFAVMPFQSKIRKLPLREVERK